MTSAQEQQHWRHAASADATGKGRPRQAAYFCSVYLGAQY